VNVTLGGLSPSALLDLAGIVEGRGLQPPFSPVQFQRLGFGSESGRMAAELQALCDLGLSLAALVRVLRLIAEERLATQRASDRTELVWTGPETPGACNRDTGVVVRDLLAAAERSVLVATYAIFRGRDVFQPLAERMDRKQDLHVRLFVNVPRPHLDQTSDSQVLKTFAEAFRRDHWPGARLPEVFYDPRSLSTKPGVKASLHAKVIVVDDCRALVTSANFTEAAHERNIETGVLIDSASFATSLRIQFDSLVEHGIVARLL
jgi:phosphatidylserine/phosphatidylglycerophosphate/cardiolipin synthase-like enzyme